jgi:hypothetical protein
VYRMPPSAADQCATKEGVRLETQSLTYRTPPLVLEGLKRLIALTMLTCLAGFLAIIFIVLLGPLFAVALVPGALVGIAHAAHRT